VNRREFVTLLGGAAVEWPVAARAQQPNYADDRILAQFVARWCRTLVAAFRQGLNITGFVEVRTLVEYRNIAAPAAKAATRSILIVFAGGAQPPGRRAASANARIAAALSCGD